MLVSLSHAVGDYLQNVFFLQLNWWVLLGYVGQSLFAMRFIVQGLGLFVYLRNLYFVFRERKVVSVS